MTVDIPTAKGINAKSGPSGRNMKKATPKEIITIPVAASISIDVNCTQKNKYAHETMASASQHQVP
jgi:hypothetical protein